MPTSPPRVAQFYSNSPLPRRPASCISVLVYMSVFKILFLLNLRPPRCAKWNGDHAIHAVANAAGFMVQAPRRTAAVRRGEPSATWKRGQHLPAAAMVSFTGALIQPLQQRHESSNMGDSRVWRQHQSATASLSSAGALVLDREKLNTGCKPLDASVCKQQQPINLHKRACSNVELTLAAQVTCSCASVYQAPCQGCSAAPSVYSRCLGKDILSLKCGCVYMAPIVIHAA